MRQHLHFRTRIGVMITLVIAVGGAEWAAQRHQADAVVPDVDWERARDSVQQIINDNDLVVFAPPWVAPIGRQFFDEPLTSFAMATRADDSRYRRVIEVSVRGAHLEAFQPWILQEERHVGQVTVRVRTNPRFRPVQDDLFRAIDDKSAQVVRIDRHHEATACPWRNGSILTGGLDFGTGIPATRASCFPNMWIGETILTPIDFSARRCIHVTTAGRDSAIAITFPRVRLGRALMVHQALQWSHEHGGDASPVTTTWSADGATLGSSVHRNGDGWSEFEIDTSMKNGSIEQLEVKIECATAGRSYCFEATTRLM